MTANVTPWETISSTLSFRSKDAQFWWDRTGRMFAKLIEKAGYTIEEQYHELQFYALFVAPQLGPAPDESMPWEGLRTRTRPQLTLAGNGDPRMKAFCGTLSSPLSHQERILIA